MPVKDQFRLRALTAIQGGSARHLGTSLKEQAPGVKFTPVLSLPLFFLLVYLVFMPGGAAATHEVFEIEWIRSNLSDSARLLVSIYLERMTGRALLCILFAERDSLS